MAVTFTRASPGTHDASTATFTSPTTTTITANALQVRGDRQRYKDLGLNLQTMPTLLVAPTSYNLVAWTTEFVRPGDTVVWCNATYTVKDVEVIAPDGVVIAARVVIAR